MTMSELEHGPGSPMQKLHLDPTMIDSDDNSFVDEVNWKTGGPF